MTLEKLKIDLIKIKEALNQTEQLFYQLKGQESLLVNQIKEEESIEKAEPKIE